MPDSNDHRQETDIALKLPTSYNQPQSDRIERRHFAVNCHKCGAEVVFELPRIPSTAAESMRAHRMSQPPRGYATGSAPESASHSSSPRPRSPVSDSSEEAAEARRHPPAAPRIHAMEPPTQAPPDRPKSSMPNAPPKRKSPRELQEDDEDYMEGDPHNPVFEGNIHPVGRSPSDGQGHTVHGRSEHFWKLL